MILNAVGGSGDGSRRIGRSGAGCDLVVRVADLEYAWLVGRGCVVAASFGVEPVLAQTRARVVGVVAGFEAEDAGTDKVVPIDDLIVGVVVAGLEVGVNEGTESVATQIVSKRIHLTTRVTNLDVDVLAFVQANDFKVTRSVKDLDAGESARRDDPGAMALFRAPGDRGGFSVGYGRIRCRGSPEAEVINTVDKGGLALRIGTFCGRITDIIA